MVQRSVTDLFSRNMINKVHKAEPTEGMLLLENLIKWFFKPSRIFDLREEHVDFPSYFWFKKKKLWIKEREKNTTLVDQTLDHTSPQFYPVICLALVTLLTFPVSTCAAEHSLSGMSEERLSPLAILYIHKHKNVGTK